MIFQDGDKIKTLVMNAFGGTERDCNFPPGIYILENHGPIGNTDEDLFSVFDEERYCDWVHPSQMESAIKAGKALLIQN